MNVTPFTSRFIGATIIWIIRKSMSSNGVQIKKKRGGAEKKQNKFIDNVYPRICSIPLQRWSEIIVRMKFHSSANRFVRTCFQPLSILLPSSYSRLPSFPFLSCKSFLFFSLFLSLSSCPRRKKTKRKLLVTPWKDAEDKGTQRDPPLCRGTPITIVSP